MVLQLTGNIILDPWILDVFILFFFFVMFLNCRVTVWYWILFVMDIGIVSRLQSIFRSVFSEIIYRVDLTFVPHDDFLLSKPDKKG